MNSIDTDDQTEIIYDIELSPINDVEYLAEINKIYFDFDKHNIHPDAAAELDKLVNLMKNDFPGLVIEIGSHTDFRGSIEYKAKLAERRAQATYDYLISKRISPERIVTYKGYGELEPDVDSILVMKNSINQTGDRSLKSGKDGMIRLYLSNQPRKTRPKGLVFYGILMSKNAIFTGGGAVIFLRRYL